MHRLLFSGFVLLVPLQVTHKYLLKWMSQFLLDIRAIRIIVGLGIANICHLLDELMYQIFVSVFLYSQIDLYTLVCHPAAGRKPFWCAHWCDGSFWVWRPKYESSGERLTTTTTTTSLFLKGGRYIFTLRAKLDNFLCFTCRLLISC